MRSATKNRVGRDPKYLEWIHTLECIIPECTSRNLHKWADVSGSRIEAAHIGMRGLSQKCPDREAMPICAFHHREGPQALHRLGKKFWEFWGIDRDDLIAELNKKYDEEQHSSEEKRNAYMP